MMFPFAQTGPTTRGDRLETFAPARLAALLAVVLFAGPGCEGLTYDLDELSPPGEHGQNDPNDTNQAECTTDGDCDGDDVCRDDQCGPVCDPEASPFEVATGSSQDPWLVAGADHLVAITGHDLDGNYRLCDDIDMSDADSFEMIGSADEPFTGTLDGDGHTIENFELHLEVPPEGVAGLSGRIGDGGVVEDLTIGPVNVEVPRPSEDFDSVGGLVGHNQGTINNVSIGPGMVWTEGFGEDSEVGGLVGFNEGSVEDSDTSVDVVGGDSTGGLVGYNDHVVETSLATGEVLGDDGVGGLVGLNLGTIRESTAEGDVDGLALVGGAVGYNHGGTIEQSRAFGRVTAQEVLAGGLCGHNEGGTIDQSYATGDVEADAFEAGGLSGSNDNGAVIENSYALGDVSSTEDVGGLVGRLEDGSDILDSYSAGEVDGDDYVGGLVGWRADGHIQASYWDTDTAGVSQGVGGTDDDTLGEGVEGLPTAEFNNEASYDQWDFQSIWRIAPVDENRRAQLQWTID